MTYDNTNSGALFKNSAKKTEKHPDYTGTVNVEGTDYQLAAWIKTSKAGKPYMSLAISEKQEDKKAESHQPFQDDVPF